MVVHTGRHFLQIPGPTNVPDRVLRAMDMPTIDHRGPEFAALGRQILADLRTVFRTSGPVIVYPGSGTGGWEAAIVNALAPGDRVLMAETGHFAAQWKLIAERFRLQIDFIPGDWRHGIDPDAVEARLREDRGHALKAVMVVHNETSTGIASDAAAVRAAPDRAAHPALLMVDAVSSLGSMPFEHDGWRVDVTVAASQKGLMLPPGLAFNALSDKALAAAKANAGLRSYWDWHEIIASNASGSWPYTPATNMLYGLREAIAMLHEEGLDNVFARHRRHAAATRAAVRGWGLELHCLDPRGHSAVVTGVRMPEGHDADQFRKAVLEAYDMSLGSGLSKLKGKVFRIGHIGHFNDLMLMGTLAGVEMGLMRAGVPHRSGGVQAAIDLIAGRGGEAQPEPRSAVA